MRPRTFVVGCVLPQPAAVGQASPDDLPEKAEGRPSAALALHVL